MNSVDIGWAEFADADARQLRRVGTASLVLAIVVLVSTVWTASVNLLEARQASARTEIARSFLQRTDALLSSLKDAETSQRGFLLTGEARYLDPYKGSVAAVGESLRFLEKSPIGSTEQRARISRLSGLIRDKKSEMDQTIGLRQGGGVKPALDLMLTDRGKATMDEIRRVCRQLSEAEYVSLERRADEVERHQFVALVVAAAGAAILFTLIVAGVLALDRATHKREQLTREIDQARKLLETTLSSIGDGVIATDAGGKISFLNPVAEALTGYTQAEAGNKALNEVFRTVNEESREPLEDSARRVLRLGAVAGLANHTLLIRRDGSEIPIDDSGAPIRNPAGDMAGVVLVFRNVAERRRAEKALADSEARLRLALEAGNAGTWDWDLATGQIVWSKSHYVLFGYAPDSVQASYESFVNALHPEDVERVEAEMKKATGSGTDFHCEYRVVWPDGSVHWIEGRGRCSADASGKPVRMMGAVVDVTQRKLAQEMLLRANEELQQFAYAASHDLQEPLRTLMGCAQLLDRNYQSKLDDDGRELVQFIFDGAKRMSVLIADLLALSRAGMPADYNMRAVGMNDVLRSTITGLKAAIEDSRAEVLAGELPWVAGDAAQLRQLLQNLLSNAIKYARAGVAPQIRVEAVREGEEWRFSVSDNGLGFKAEQAAAVFQPFKRLHGGEIPGTGIGLAICKRIVERHGGRIWAESSPGAGTTFYFTLPAMAAQTA